MQSSLLDNLVFIDIKSTGYKPTIDRIIEIGLYQYSIDDQIFKWSKMVNPEIPIPEFIRHFIQIDDSLLKKAPRFALIAGELAEIIKDKVLVFNNANLQFSFLKNEFKNAEIKIKAKVICLTKLIQLLFPTQEKMNLERLFDQFNLSKNQAHTALGSAKLIMDCFIQLQNVFSIQTIQQAIAQITKQPMLPLHLPTLSLADIPHTPGVYHFYGADDNLLYIGKSINLRERIQSHFTSAHNNNKEMQMLQQVKKIDWIETAGEIGALLLEAKLVKQLMPIFNRKLRRHKTLFTFYQTTNANGYCQLQIMSCNQVNNEQSGQTYGLFRKKFQAQEVLRTLAKEHALCLKLTGLASTKGACFYYQIHKCRGACIEQETAPDYNARVHQALTKFLNKSWHFPNKIAIREICSFSQRQQFHVIDQWCHVTTVNHEKELYQDEIGLLPLQFDLDIYKILVQCLENSEKPVDVIHLS